MAAGAGALEQSGCRGCSFAASSARSVGGRVGLRPATASGCMTEFDVDRDRADVRRPIGPAAALW